ncbi:MAG: xanthine dehydrogenase family protein molybdopterin-binding subunit [Thermoplasmata archaeon]|nr:xanthine dehydrogenase family protein molybdopterin-binding subunit [Thermoplasmata archaeon]MCI4359567.1 xanthine dehydrogenase family protein molybdopterin-binding subunit [Thermoplasmata archaeon]
MTRSDAGVKLSGRARFGMDLDVAGMAWGALVPSPVAHGRLLDVDVSAARTMPGVVAAIGPTEVERLLPSAQASERPLFPRQEVVYRGQPVAAVAARTLSQARSAAAAVRVRVESLPVLSDIEQRFPEWPGPGAAGSEGVVAHVHARFGPVERAFESAELVHSETYRTSGVCQVAIEPHACIAEATAGGWHVTTTTQTPFGVREDAAEILGIAPERLVVEGTWVGGGFGGKGAAFLEPYALALASASGTPVRLAFGYPEEFGIGRTTLGSVIRLDTAVSGGTITARRVRLLLESGASLPGRDFATGYSIGFLLGPYRVSAYEVEGYAVQTHKPPFGPHRAPFAPQCVFAEESHLEGLARRLGVDPIEFREAQVWKEGDATFLGQPVGPFGASRALAVARKTVDRWRVGLPEGHGIGVGLGFWSTSTSAGGEVRLRLSDSGLVIEQGEHEIGSGSIVRGLVAVAERVTGLPGESIRVTDSDTASAPFDSGVFGSRTVAALGRAIEGAGRLLLQTLAARTGDSDLRLEAGASGIVIVGASGSRRVSSVLTENERADGGLVVGGKHYGQGGAIDGRRVLDGTFYSYTDFTAALHVCEVDVDRETGTVQVVRSAAIHDVGTVLDSQMVRGQVEGGVAMGLGTALTEETLWSGEGRMLNPSLLDYRIPTLGEVPPIEIVTLEGERGAGPFGAKGMGEPPIIAVPAAVANAVYDATRTRVFELPLTPERVSRALKLAESHPRR